MCARRVRVDKSEILSELRARVAHDLETMITAQRLAAEGATHEESRPENDKDTRALEASYLARGQAQRAAELGRSLQLLNALELRAFPRGSLIGLGALVTLDDGNTHTHYFLAPAGGGLRLSLGSVEVRVVSPESPIGRALLGKCEDDDCDIRTPQGVAQYSICAVS
jgi:transcription elongation GreA/GreB family factor